VIVTPWVVGSHAQDLIVGLMKEEHERFISTNPGENTSESSAWDVARHGRFPIS